MKIIKPIVFIAVLLAINIPIAIAQYTKSDSIKVQEYLEKSDKLYYEDKIDSSIYYCLQARDLAQRVGYKRGMADFISSYLPILNRQGKYHEALALAKEGIAICQEIGDNVLISVAYNNAANDYQYLGDFKSAARDYLNALVFVANTGDTWKEQRYSNNLASVFLQMEELDKSLHYAKKSYDLALQNKDSAGMASSLVNLSVNQLKSGKLDDATRHLTQVARLGEALGDYSYVLDSYLTQADVEFRRNDPRASLVYYTKCSEVLKQYPSPDYELYVFWGFANAYHQLKNERQANLYVEKSISLAKELGVLDELRKIYPLASEINEKMNKLDVALEYRKKYETLNDSLLNAATQQTIHTLETEYRTAEKEKDLAEQKLIIARKEFDIQKKDKVIFLSTTIAVALLSLMVISFLAYRNRQRVNRERMKLLEKQNEVKVLTANMEGQEKERARLARELHDGVGGVLSAAKMHLSIVPGDVNISEAMTMLDQASQEIRTIAHNLSPNMIQVNELHTVLGEYCARVKSAQLAVDYYVMGAVPKLEPAFKLGVYRAFQEIMNNVIKHSRATHVMVQLSINDDLLMLTVEDNGVGFDTNIASGNGLTNLRTRVAELRGEIQITSTLSKGTTVQLDFDLQPYLVKDNQPIAPAEQELHLS